MLTDAKATHLLHLSRVASESMWKYGRHHFTHVVTNTIYVSFTNSQLNRNVSDYCPILDLELLDCGGGGNIRLTTKIEARGLRWRFQTLQGVSSALPNGLPSMLPAGENLK